MSGGWMTYHCERCPLVLELGGFLSVDESGTVTSESDQVACAACGTLHRVTEERGDCRVTALPGPVRTSRPVVVRDGWGQEFETEEWFSEDEWRPAGELPGGIKALDRLACCHCGQVGRMLTLAGLLYPDGIGTPRREVCPVCRGPMECVGISDAI